MPASGPGQLRLTDVLILGNSQSGAAPFMDWSQTVGIDQRQKALVWEN